MKRHSSAPDPARSPTATVATVNQAEAAGHLLANRHEVGVEAEHGVGLLAFAETDRDNGWTLRSALVRLAQPEPVRAGALLELVRRFEWALQPMARNLERYLVSADRQLSWSRLIEAEDGWAFAPPEDRYPDARVTDLARLNSGNVDEFKTVLAAYSSRIELEPDELAALPLLALLLSLDQLAETLVIWALVAPNHPPIEQIDEVCHRLHVELEALGVTAEADPARQERPRRR